ncbi:glycosyltransferase [Parapedobacter sp. 2B3]|uniref:glycosyltransferase n=1 Tax=Parapedobacter sp. 2B3 TaxID=3342381 RepID=UPI0035B5D33C
MDALLLLLDTCWLAAQLLIGAFLVCPVVSYVVHRFARCPVIQRKPGTEADYAVILTVFGHVNGVSQAIESLLKMDYPNFHVYVVLDNCEGLDFDFAHEKVTLLRPPGVLAGNTKSHFYAIDRFIRRHDRLTIIDSDNLVHRQYLRALDAYFDDGFQAVQGVRKAKNMDTTLACLDAARDAYYHFYDGKLLFEVGSSATLAGSGMAFTVALYRECLEKVVVEGAGFDKVLQFEIVKRGHRIAFAPDAWVFDEKTAHSDQLVKQRSRWINTWFRYVKFGFKLLGRGLRRWDRNQLWFGFILLRPPLFIFLLLAALALSVNAVTSNVAGVMCWLAAFLLFGCGFFIAMHHANLPRSVYRALRSIPRFMFYQVVSLTKARKANQISVATKHTVIKHIDDMD